MRDKRSAPLAAPQRRGRVCIAEGFGIRIHVDRQHLTVEDGLGRDRRTRRYARATHGLARLVVIGTEGYITLDAARWLTSLGIGYLHLDRDGTILSASDTGGGGDARLRRQQALAATSPVGIEVARFLLGLKLAGQARNLEHLAGRDRCLQAVQNWLARVHTAASLDELLEAEREAAAAYWSCWTNVPLRFSARDRSRVPEHWLKIGTRHSPLSGGPRVAITPANAMLNYLYAICEAEARLACLALGLDPGLGIWHADYRARDSFALDLMEAARPAVDRHVLELIEMRTFSRREFGETSRGICRLLAPLSQELAQTASLWRAAIAPHAEHVANMLAQSPGSRVDESRTPLTQRRRRDAQDVKRRPRLRASGQPAGPKPRCKRCGEPVPHRERTYCDSCWELPQHERRAKVVSASPGVVEGAAARSRRCKQCGEPVPNRKRVYCDTCFADYEARLISLRRGCKRCGEPVPNRKRVYCDGCLDERAADPVAQSIPVASSRARVATGVGLPPP